MEQLTNSFLHVLLEKRKLISDVTEEDCTQKWTSMHKKTEKPIPEFFNVREAIKSVTCEYFNLLKVTPCFKMRKKILNKQNGLRYLGKYNADLKYEHGTYVFV